MSKRKKITDEPKPIKLDISFMAKEPQSGHELGKFDPQKLPWPLKDGSVEELFCAFLLCRIPAAKRAPFMDEAYRVLVPNGKMTVIVPYYSSVRAHQDPTHEWPPFSEHSFFYFNADWRKVNAPYLECKCDFDFGYGYIYDAETQGRSDDARPEWVKHKLNAVTDVQVVLTKKG